MKEFHGNKFNASFANLCKESRKAETSQGDGSMKKLYPVDIACVEKLLVIFINKYNMHYSKSVQAYLLSELLKG